LTNLRNAGHEFGRPDLIAVFRGLEQIGCGNFKTGRRGWPSRFEWITEITSVGRAAIGEQEEVQQIEAATEEVGADEIDWLTHTFHLRPNVEIELDLPMDLSPNEAARFAQFIATLPFEHDD
jgi:hypothetical protein